MIFGNSVKLDNEMWIETRVLIFLERRLEDKSMESKITEFGSRFAEKSSNEQERNFSKIKSQKIEIESKINSNCDLKMKSKAIQRKIRMNMIPNARLRSNRSH